LVTKLQKGRRVWKEKRIYEYKIKEDKITLYLEQKPDTYQSETAQHFNTGQSTINRTLKRLKITRKKDKTI